MKRRFFLIWVGFFLLAFSCKINASKIKIVVNGEDITSKSESFIKNDRVMVPIRFVSEALGKEVKYLEATKEISITENERSVKLKLDSELIEISGGNFVLSDVKVIAKGDRTYVPVRAVAEAFNLNVDFDFNSKTVSINDGVINPADSYSVNGLVDTITDQTSFTVSAGENILPRIDTTKLLVLDPNTKKGYINDISKGLKVNYIPWSVRGKNILMVVSYDKNGNIVAGRGKLAENKIMPKVSISGPENGGSYSDMVSINPNMNFIAKSVSYTVTDLDTNETTTFDNKDPYAPWQLRLQGGDKKNISVSMSVIDMDGINYVSNSIDFNLNTPREIKLTGVKEGDKINRTLNLNVSRNFDVQSTRYFLGSSTGEVLLEEKPYGGHIFNPPADYSGNYYLRAEVTLPGGEEISTDKVNVNIVGGSRLLLQGVGPKAVITEPVELSYDSNIVHTSIKYVFEGVENFTIQGMLKGKTSFDPKGKKDGDYKVYAQIDGSNGKVNSEVITVKIHNGKTFGPSPVVEKSKFIDTFSPMAIKSFNKTGMASSIQMAQAILETGWGQYVPVDKYSGKSSKNLFGIKGSSTNGSVISNTWEEYNGVKYRVDDAFRAYNSLEESWNDHKNLLLTKERYQIFRDVMFDPIRGAWAIRRAGYATDSEYPGKLIKLIESQDLRRFDEVGF